MAATNSILEHSVLGDVVMSEAPAVQTVQQIPTLPKTVQANSSAAMKLLGAHGIRMIPEDNGPSPLETNMRSGSKTFTLTEAGKRALNLPSSITVNRTAKPGTTQVLSKPVTHRIVSTNGQKVTKVIKLADGTTKPLSSLTGGGIVKTESGKKIFISAEQVAKIRARSQGMTSQSVTLANGKPAIVRTIASSSPQVITSSSGAGGQVKKTVKIIRVNSQGGVKSASGTPIVVRPSPASMSSAGKPTIITVNSAGRTVRPTLASVGGSEVAVAGKPRTVIVSASSPAAAVAAASGVTTASSTAGAAAVAAAAAAASSSSSSDADELKRKLDEALKALARVSEENKELKKLKTATSQEN